MERENDLKIEIGNLTRDRDSAKEEVRLLERNGDLVELESSGNGDAAEIVAVNATSPGDCKSSISSGSKNFGLSKKGSACGTHTLIPGAGRFSKIARSSSAAAAGDIIEIIDSDNETNPDRAADVSNVGVNEMNFVRSPSCSKRNGIDVDNVLLIHEARPASDSQTPLEEFDGLNDDEVSTDSDDSCTDSRMDDLIASFRSKAAENRSRR
ncbi:hypothetical protein PHJA_000397400 [Phtheirospermum japonicum]|uniref:Uncharacterized protein n=1 Tax=Phtheirospermum japonicum TaxID=374723 RepID=A0A830BCP1_9LAMI|nr:hypothetical protein PHJA_000397400 [Phtheirospermum japonicum]